MHLKAFYPSNRVLIPNTATVACGPGRPCFRADLSLLLDEADVFLQRRAELTLERNRLVAVFLRKLEYYDGVLFLTANLVGPAVRRCHSEPDSPDDEV